MPYPGNLRSGIAEFSGPGPMQIRASSHFSRYLHPSGALSFLDFNFELSYYKDKTMNVVLRRTSILFLAVACLSCAFAQNAQNYEALVQKGKAQLEAGHADQALASGEQAIKMSAARWEGYALAGGALMNLKQ